MSLSSVFGDRPGNAFAVATRYDLNALSTTLRTFIAEMQKKINTILERLDAFGKEHNSDRKTDDLRWQTSDERWSETQKMFKQLDSTNQLILNLVASNHQNSLNSVTTLTNSLHTIRNTTDAQGDLAMVPYDLQTEAQKE